MNLLVIGGSYFYGRVFVMEAATAHRLTLLNRGTYSMKEFGVQEIVGDRHDGNALAKCAEDYDAVIDFCAYTAGDVKSVIESLPGKIGQYILISTVDVYERGSGLVKTEECAESFREKQALILQARQRWRKSLCRYAAVPGYRGRCCGRRSCTALTIMRPGSRSISRCFCKTGRFLYLRMRTEDFSSSM